MKTSKSLALASLTLTPAFAIASSETVDDQTAADEIVVVGRSVETGSARIEVERELLVDTAAALRDIPGATVNRNGPLTGIAQYRGMFGDRVAVDIDQLGVISGGPNAMDAPLSYMSPMMTEKLVVTRGIAGVSLAPETIGGHISTRTSRGEFSTGGASLSGMIGTRYSNNGNISTSSARLTLANERHRASVIAEFDDGDDVKTPEGTIVPTRLERDRYDLSYAWEADRSNALVYAGKLDTGETGTPALPMDIIFVDTELYGAQVGFEATPNLAVVGRVRYNDVSHVMDNFSLREGPMAPMQRLNTTAGSGTQHYLAGTVEMPRSTLVVGIDGISATHESVISNPSNAMFRIDNFVDVKRELNGAFAEWSRDAGRGELEAGLRYNRVRTDAHDVAAVGMMGMMGEMANQLATAFNSAPRDLGWNSVNAVFKYRLPTTDSNEWSFELGSKSRAPSYQELYLWLPMQATGGLADGRTYIGNLGLDAERSKEVVVGLSSRMGRTRVAPQVFYRRIDDYIQGVPSTNMTANMLANMMTGKDALQFENVDAEIWGADVAWSYEISSRLLLDGIVSIVRGQRLDASDDLYRLSPLNGSVGLTYSGRNWSFKSEILGYARQERVSIVNDEATTPGYWLINLGFRWNPTAALRVEARVENLLDESYQNHVTGINRAAGSDIPVGERLYGAGRTASAGVVFTF
jgi:iron complex outermembrane receptor protein